jgi:hypothetical protein
MKSALGFSKMLPLCQTIIHAVCHLRGPRGICCSGESRGRWALDAAPRSVTHHVAKETVWRRDGQTAVALFRSRARLRTRTNGPTWMLVDHCKRLQINLDGAIFTTNGVTLKVSDEFGHAFSSKGTRSILDRKILMPPLIEIKGN